jgi:hypothetical protein
MTVSTNGQNGYHEPNGRFLTGAPAGPGNPCSRKTNNFRKALYECVSDEDFAAVVRALVDAAKAGQSWAVKEFLGRLLGKPVTGVIAMQVAEKLASQWNLDNLDEDERGQLGMLLSKVIQGNREWK